MMQHTQGEGTTASCVVVVDASYMHRVCYVSSCIHIHTYIYTIHIYIYIYVYTHTYIYIYVMQHTQGEGTTASRVVLMDGVPAKHLYRTYTIRCVYVCTNRQIDEYIALGIHTYMHTYM